MYNTTVKGFTSVTIIYTNLQGKLKNKCNNGMQVERKRIRILNTHQLAEFTIETIRKTNNAIKKVEVILMLRSSRDCRVKL